MDLLELPWDDVIFRHVFLCLSLPDLFRLRATSRDWQHCVDIYFTKKSFINLTHFSNQMTASAFSRATFQNTNIRSLTLRNSKAWLTDAVLVPFLDNSKKLKHFDLAYCSAVSNASIQKLAVCCQGLEDLCLRDCHWLSREGLLIISMNCVSLKKVDIAGCWQIDDEAISILVNFCKKIEYLCIAKIYGLTDLCIDHIATNLKDLKHINLQGCWRVTDNGIRKLAEYCKNLKGLQVNDCRDITEGSLARIRCRGVQIDKPAPKWAMSSNNIKYLQDLNLQV